jgi:hypothetical protein
MHMPHVSRLLVFLAALAALRLATAPAARASAEDDDRKTLADAQVETDGPALLEFLRHRSLTDERREQLEQQIRDLGSKKFAVRQRATRKLIAQGTAALPFLRQALTNPDVEVVTRAKKCIKAIQRGPGPAVPLAAVRQLVRLHPARTVETFLLYLPFAEDEAVAEEVVQGLYRLSREAKKIDPALTAALRDKVAARRGAAAYVTARVGDAKERAAVRRLLGDLSLAVRFQAAHGLLSARDKSAVPVLIDLLKQAPRPLVWQAEELLGRVAGDKRPRAPVGTGATGERKKACAAWEGWWKTQGARIDWKTIDVGMLGGTLVAELETETVWEAGPGGKVRWEIEDLQGPYDAQRLGGGHILVAEYTGQRVTERDAKGKVVWKKEIDDPVCCRRGPSGNTFIATVRGVVEVKPDGKEAYAYTLTKQEQPVQAAYKAWNTGTVYIACQAGLLVLDTTAKKLAAKRLPVDGELRDIQGLANGNLLVTFGFMRRSGIRELDPAGKVIREFKVKRASSATQLANGHFVVASSSDRRLVELDGSGKPVWQKATVGRPIRVRRR